MPTMSPEYWTADQEQRREALRLALQHGPCDAVPVAEKYYQFLIGAKKPAKKAKRK